MSDSVTRLNSALEGRYEIERELGEGGMATVYLAKDLKHNRNVALKVLKPELAAVVGAERFLAEIETTANLQHPHILPLFDSGEAGSFLFYVMPHIEGESLRERLEREKQLPVDEAVRIATDVAEALHSAHEQGVIHRDIKPANILMSKGRPLVADFGIALAVAQAGGGRLTETGLSMGTPYYMSPEQASADREPTPASDVYSLGCVLYEMLVGEPPYVGSSAQAVLAKILMADAPAPTTTRSSIPANVDAAIRKALEKLPADRFGGADEFARALGDTSFRLAYDAAAAAAAAGRWPRLGPAMTGVAALAIGLALWGWLRPAPVQSVARYELAPPGGLDRPIDDISAFHVSPDGSWLVYGGSVAEEELPQLWTKAQDQATWTPVPGTEGGIFPRFSPDGTRIAYIESRRGDLHVVPAQGGASTRVSEAGPFAWLDNESLVVSSPQRDGLLRVRAAGGGEAAIWTSDSLVAWGLPSVFANGEAVLVAMCAACPLDMTLYTVDVATGDAQPVYPALYGQYAESGDLVIVEVSGRVLAGPFDASRRELTGDVVPILDGVSTGRRSTGFIMSEAGTAITVLGPPARADVTQTLYEPVWVARDGAETLAVEGWRFQLSNNFGHALSPDGSLLAIGLESDDGADVWIKELPDGPLTRLTLDPEDDARPTWSVDGAYIWHQSTRGGDGLELYRRRADGAGQPQHFPTPGRAAQQAEPTPDGEWMVVRVDGSDAGAETGRDIVAYRTSGDSTEVPLLVTEYDEYSPSLSPDGRWLAYVSTESGRPEVYIRPFPNVDEGRWQVSNAGGMHPLWKGDGTELYYVSARGAYGESFPGRVMTAVAVETTSTFVVLSREPLFELSPELLTTTPWEPVVDVDADGSRFFMMRRVPEASEQEDYHLVVVQNFLEELKRLVPN